MRRARALASLALAGWATLGCGATIDDAPGDAAPVYRVTVGPIGLPQTSAEEAPTLRAGLAADDLTWITAVGVEAPETVAVTDAGITLDVEADVVRVSDDSPSLELPPGFGVPVARARAGLPAQWRGLHATARAVGRHGPVAGATVDVIVRGVRASDGTPVSLWRIPIEVAALGIRVRAADGSESIKVAVADLLPAPGTIHAVVPRTGGRTTEVRIVRIPERVVAARLTRAPDGTIDAWTDAEGIPVAPASDVRLELDLREDAAAHGVAIDLYLRPRGDRELSYEAPELRRGSTGR